MNKIKVIKVKTRNGLIVEANGKLIKNGYEAKQLLIKAREGKIVLEVVKENRKGEVNLLGIVGLVYLVLMLVVLLTIF